MGGGIHTRILGGFDQELDGATQSLIADETAAVEALYEHAGYTVSEAYIDDAVEPPTWARYHGRDGDTVHISLSSLEPEDVDGVWAHELGHDVGRQTFYEEIEDEPLLYRSLADEAFAYLVQYEVTDDVPDRSAVAERYFGDQRQDWTSLLNGIDSDSLEAHGDRLMEVEESFEGSDLIDDAFQTTVDALPTEVADNMLIDQLPLQDYLDSCDRVEGMVELVDEAEEDGEIDDTALGAALYGAAAGDGVLEKPVQDALYRRAYERSDDGFGGFMPDGEAERLMRQYARSEGLDLAEEIIEDELDQARSALEEQWELAGADDTVEAVMAGVQDEKYGYGAGDREGYTRYIDFPHGAGRLLAATMYENGVRSEDITERPEAVVAAGRGMVHDIIDGAIHDRDIADHGAQYARGNLRLQRVIRG